MKYFTLSEVIHIVYSTLCTELKREKLLGKLSLRFGGSNYFGSITIEERGCTDEEFKHALNLFINIYNNYN